MIINGKLMEDIEIIHESESEIKLRANEVIILECKGGESFDSVFSRFSTENREMIKSEIERNGGEYLRNLLPHLYLRKKTVAFYVAFGLVWFLTITMVRLKWRKVPVFYAGRYDTGVRIPCEMVLSKEEWLRVEQENVLA